MTNKRVGPADDPDRYELIDLTSRGAEGELWKGAITVDGHQLPVAIKIAHSSASVDISDWERQAEVLRSLEHPSIVKVREVFQGPLPHDEGVDAEERTVFLVMNWAPGESLVSWCSTNPNRDALEVTRVVSRIAGAVDYLHSGKGTGGVPVLHRDIKPANVMIDGPDLRLVDFGFARLAGDQPTMAGTPAYLAPEVIAGGRPSEASDRFGLGATAYFLYTGEDPVHNDESAMRSKLVGVRGLEGREDVANHLLAMMSRDPARRPSNVVDWAQALAVGTVSQQLTFVGSAPPKKSKQRGLLVAAACLLLVALVGGGVAYAMNGKKANTHLTQANAASLGSSGGQNSATSTTTRPSSLPDVTNQPVAQATNTLRGLGLTVVENDVVNTSVADGLVISQNPVAGSPIGTTVTIQVARQPVGTFLSDMQTVSGNVDTQPQSVSGTSYAHSVTFDDVYSGAGGISGPSQAGYDLGRSYQQFKATVGLSDSSDQSAKVDFEVLGDGRMLFNQTLGLGQVANVSVDVTNVLRLTISATLTNPDAVQHYPSAVFGDAEAFGVPSQVPGYSSSTTSSSIG